ncbi:DUF5701 family protein [Streptomyces sp. NRRL F-5727]|uniref:DUF5701 family protein n=1 Tax=Streptomyces sp. NRRL F-5727 TaxID=1463871 RepID=UPI00055C2476|nr:DUF5701 family protein [Streptomyces sp. NRRL F-5727]
MPDAQSTTPSAFTTSFPLPSLTDQAERLIELGVPALTGIDAGELRAFAEKAAGAPPGALLAVHPDAAPASALAPLLRRADKPGFVVVDMADVDAFTPQGVDLPEGPFYLVHDLDRGDHLGNWSPEEAIPALHEAGRTPLVLTEGIHWLLQRPDVLERNKCFMAIGSRLRKPNGSFDARTPAIWISNGTGRDGKERKDAPKVGWCWWNNRHTWLGFGSTTGRTAGLDG